MKPRNPYFVAVYSQLPCRKSISLLYKISVVVTYWGVYPCHHAACYDEATIALFIYWLLTEVMNGQFPGVECAIYIDPDDIEVRFRWLAFGI